MIYETNGRAREYFELAANPYPFCEHECLSCYAPEVVHKAREVFFSRGEPRAHILEELGADARRLAKIGERRHIMLQFIGDPYQPADVDLKITREVIKLFHSYGLFVALCTKGGNRAKRDFDILTEFDLFGQSLTCHSPATFNYWEPKASKPEERLDVFRIAKEEYGLKTWASCEPVYNAAETLELIEAAAPWVDVFKVGKLNYRPESRLVDWKKFASDAVALLDRLGKSYYIKRDPARYIGQPEGITKGDVPK
jgi:DNA repair photolyase